jgi:hypothetical protein
MQAPAPGFPAARAVTIYGIASWRRSRYVRRPRPGRQQAAEWFASEDDTHLYSFVSICQALSLDAGAIRRALLTPQREAA